MTRIDRRSALRMLALAFLVAIAPRPAAAEEEPDTALVAVADPAEAAAPARTADGLEALVPELAEHPYRIAPGVRQFQHRLAFSPGYGTLGSKSLFVARVTYYPNTWLGYEWSIGHNPGQSVHAALHMLSVVVRKPLSGRFQPYGALGYGMMLVFPGQSINADPVTKNALTYGGGLEFFIRGDLAVRADMRGATVLGRERDRDGIVAYDYLHQTIGLAFYRSIRP
jgi:opacity protein-like surface antigen